MIAAVAIGVAAFTAAFALSFATTRLLYSGFVVLLACGGRGPSCPKPRAAGDSYDSRPVTCEVRR